MSHPSVMLDMEMGTGKTKVAIDVLMDRPDVYRVLVVCPKPVISVWKSEIKKHVDGTRIGICVWGEEKGTVEQKAEHLSPGICADKIAGWKQIVILNYEVVWRKPMNKTLRDLDFDMVILDESHRAKSAGSKTSKFLGILGRSVKYKMCLSGTPMANSPLDVYGQYRFLNHTIYGTKHNDFLSRYAIFGGPERKFIVGFKNQQDLNRRFQSIAYTCTMDSIKDRVKLPPKLPPRIVYGTLNKKSRNVYNELSKDFIANMGTDGDIVVKNVLTLSLRLMQICSGFAAIEQDLCGTTHITKINDVKINMLKEIVVDLHGHFVVFCTFTHDIRECKTVLSDLNIPVYILSGQHNELKEWKDDTRGALIVQLQAGSEGIDLTIAHTCIYYTLPYSLFTYEQSMARLYRPGQTRPVLFIYLLIEDSIDIGVYEALCMKKNIIEEIKGGRTDYICKKR